MPYDFELSKPLETLGMGNDRLQHSNKTALAQLFRGLGRGAPKPETLRAQASHLEISPPSIPRPPKDPKNGNALNDPATTSGK